MKIGPRLVALFLALSLLPAALVAALMLWGASDSLQHSIGANYRAIAMDKAETIEVMLEERIREASALARSPSISQHLRRANAAYDGRDPQTILRDIERIDAEWIADRQASPTATAILKNPLSRELEHYKQSDPGRYGDIFLSDLHGAAVAMTKHLSDYYQADEQWWQESYGGGHGQVFIDDRGYDLSVDTLVSGVVVPVYDGAGGTVIGILKINYRVAGILALLKARELGKQSEVFLARSKGDMLAHSRDPRRRLTEIERAAARAKAPGWREDPRPDGAGGSNIVAYAPVPVAISTRVPSPGERKGISGERWNPTTWFVFVATPQEEAFAPIARLRRMATLLFGITLVLVLIVALITARAISRPIAALRHGVEIVGAGNLHHRVGTAARDEIGDLSRAFDRMTERLRETMTSRDELERSNRELDDFAYIASHDLKEPLRGIHNYASFLLEDYQELLPGEGRDKLHAVGRLARRMEDLINALLHYSRLGRGQLADETVNMNGVLAEVIESLHLDSRGDKVAVHCPSPLPPVRGDRTRIAEVLQNLVGNAIKYNDSAEKRIEIQCLGAGDNADHGIPADHRVFRVADNGIGIRDKHLEDVFRIFKRLHRRDKYPGGTGAGLTIVRKVVERHGGVVWVESGQGEGSRFFFTLPAHIDTPGPDAGSEIAGRAALSRTSKGT